MKGRSSILRIGIFGGTFDPPHIGHLIIAEQACQQLHLNRVLFVPAYLPPHKKHGTSATAQHRYFMVKRAIEHSPRFEVTSLELRRRGVSYTIDTLKQLQRMYTNARFYLVVGGDNFSGFRTWKSVREILKLATIVVYKRKTPLGSRKKKYASDVVYLDGATLDVSSTIIRNRVHNGQSIRFLVPHAVEKYIYRHGLYR